MRFNIFSVIRQRVAEAVTGGFQDGLAAVSDPDAPAPDVAALRDQVAAGVSPRQLAPAAPTQPAAAPEPTPAPLPPAGGKRGKEK